MSYVISSEGQLRKECGLRKKLNSYELCMRNIRIH